MKILENYSLKNYNTFGVDTKAKYFAEPQHENELVELIHSDLFRQNKILILGSGSNILLTKDFDGLVIKYSSMGIKVISENENEITVESAAGEIWDDLVTYCVEHKYYGIENLSLIPGTVGAAPIQNIGAYGAELKDVLLYVEGYLTEDLKKVQISNEECRFGYRDSIFKNELRDKFIITDVQLNLSIKPKLNISYRELNEKFGSLKNDEISIQNIRETVIDIRKRKLPDPKVLGNAGSFFKNPIVNEKQFSLLKNKYKDLVYFKIDDEHYKIPAGWLIEKSGFKGKKIGYVSTYEKQALVIVNLGGATGIEIKNFADKIISEIEHKFEITLEYEVKII